MLEKLSSEQWASVESFTSQMLNAGRIVGPVDRTQAELAVKLVYAERGLVGPDLVIWARSPHEGCIFASALQSLGTTGGQLGSQLNQQLGSQLYDQFDSQLSVQIRRQLVDQLGSQLYDQLVSQLRGQLYDQLFDQLFDQLVSQLFDQLWDQLGSQLRGQLGSQLGGQLYDQLFDQLFDQLSSQLWDQLGSQLCDQLGSQLRGQLGDQLVEQIGDQLRGQLEGESEKIKEQRFKACYGPHDLYWLGFYQFLKNELGLSNKADPDPQIELAKNCGWWWPFSGAVVLTEHPVSMHLDAEGRLHSETGMAIKYSDGFGLYRWHGVQVEPDWILKPELLTPQMALTWENIEQRRVAAEIVGWHRILSELGAKTLDVDMDPQIGVLLEVSLPDSGLERFLKVECGTGRTFALPVPPSMQTALEAQCWIHGGVSPSIIRQLEVRT